MRKNYHILHESGRWAVKREGHSRAVSEHATQAEAVAQARQLARSQESELVVHGRSGRILETSSYAARPVSNAKGAIASRRSILDLPPLSLGALLRPLNSRADLEDELWPAEDE